MVCCWVFQLLKRPVDQGLWFFSGVLTCPAVVSQLDSLEDQRKKILSQCAFTIQCCWLKHQSRRRHARHQSATLIQAGKLLVPGPGSTECTLCGLSLTDQTFRLWPYCLANRNQLAQSVRNVCRLTVYPFEGSRGDKLIWLTVDDWCSEWKDINLCLHNAKNVFYASPSGAVVAGQEVGPETQQRSCSHPEHLEEVEGEIFEEQISSLMFSFSFFMVQSYIKPFLEPKWLAINLVNILKWWVNISWCWRLRLWKRGKPTGCWVRK